GVFTVWKHKLTDNKYWRIINFPYLKTLAELEEFLKWVLGLNKPKVTAWWNHKTQTGGSSPPSSNSFQKSLLWTGIWPNPQIILTKTN
ncbi:hypothetical protein B0H34DRAFT_847498, partial [Crassisporium funariophilum]